MAETPLGANSKVTVERRSQIVLIGINRPSVQNRVDPETYLGLAKAYYQYEHDPSLRAAANLGLRLTGAKRWSKKRKEI